MPDLRKLEAAATKGPWQVSIDNGSSVLSHAGYSPMTACDWPEDAEFIAAIRNAAPLLLGVVDAARLLARELAAGRDWMGFDDDLEAAIDALDKENA